MCFFLLLKLINLVVYIALLTYLLSLNYFISNVTNEGICQLLALLVDAVGGILTKKKKSITQTSFIMRMLEHQSLNNAWYSC